MIENFTDIIFVITPSKIENERDFSLSGFIGWYNQESFTVTNLSMLVFINKNCCFFNPLKNECF